MRLTGIGSFLCALRVAVRRWSEACRTRFRIGMPTEGRASPELVPGPDGPPRVWRAVGWAPLFARAPTVDRRQRLSSRRVPRGPVLRWRVPERRAALPRLGSFPG